MLFQISITWESLVAELAGEWLVPCVLSPMYDQVHFGIVPLGAAVV